MIFFFCTFGYNVYFWEIFKNNIFNCINKIIILLFLILITQKKNFEISLSSFLKIDKKKVIYHKKAKRQNVASQKKKKDG